MRLTHELVSGRDSWLRIRLTAEMEAGHQLKSLAEGGLDPVPTDLEIALAAKPMRVYPTALALFDYFRSLGDQVERSDGKQETEAR